MSMPNALMAAFLIFACSAFGKESPGLGEAVSAQELAMADYAVLPNGDGLPEGSGNAKIGATVYLQHCLACHGVGGKDGLNDRLVGGRGSLTTDKPLRTVGSFWPYATTLFDYVRRAMPYQTPGSLSNDEIYSLTAYILFLNGVVDEDAEMNANSLPGVKMPNRDSIVWDYQPE